MSHTVQPHDTLILRVDYSGEVGYRERCEALTTAARIMSLDGYTRLLVDFSAARVYEEGADARASYIAHVVTAPWPERSRIAPVNAPDFAVQGGRIAGSVRGLAVESFDSESRAIEWLLSTF